MQRVVRCFLLLALLLLIGCGNADSTSKAETPFDYSERMNYKYEEAVELFKNAGFTNVTTAEISGT